MGEYITLPNGQQGAKIGTCDDLRYVTRGELERYPYGPDAQHALKAPESLYRFPWPGDQPFSPEDHDRDMFRTFAVSSHEFRPLLGKFDHGHKVVSMSPHGGGYNVNVWVPCPLDSKSLVKLKNSGASPVITIYGERYDANGNGRTIFRCGYCEAPFSAGTEDIEVIRKAILANSQSPDDANRGFMTSVANLLMAIPEGR